MQCVVVVYSGYRWCWQHGVIRSDVDGLLCGLLDGFHFLLASRVVERADDDGLAEQDVFCGGHVCLRESQYDG